MLVALLLGYAKLHAGCGRIEMDWISWPVTALVLATVALVLSSVGNEIRRRRKFRSYCQKVVAELRSSGPAE